jgi:NADPH:quinone reductase-like Zn-dependent oxidoreductase
MFAGYAQGMSVTHLPARHSFTRERSMKPAVRIHSPGGPEALVPEWIECPVPGPGEVLVRHAFIGVNFVDVYHRKGLYPLPSYPGIPGVEGAGTVEAVGDVADPAKYRAAVDDLFAMAADGLRVCIGAEYPLSEAARAHADLEGRRTTGSILLVP